ncbi:hypothetical protein EV363DRAFT_1303075 [Boletus edulis]|nr:hypothetical protein EV363DRAFT_1303075 [Boletus edulis]
MVRESGGAGVVTRGVWAIGCLTAAVWTFLSLRSFSLARATSKRNPICDGAEENERELGEEHGKDDLRVGTVGSEGWRWLNFVTDTGKWRLYPRFFVPSDSVDSHSEAVSSLEEQQQWGYCFHSDSNKKSEWCIDTILGNPPHLAANCLTRKCRCTCASITLFLYTMLFNKLALTLLSIIAVAAAMPIVNDMALDRRDCQSQGTQGEFWKDDGLGRICEWVMDAVWTIEIASGSD